MNIGNLKYQLKYDWKKLLITSLILGILITGMTAMVSQSTYFHMRQEYRTGYIPIGDIDTQSIPQEETIETPTIHDPPNIVNQFFIISTKLIFPIGSVELKTATPEGEHLPEEVVNGRGYPLSYIGESSIFEYYHAVPLVIGYEPPTRETHIHYLSFLCLVLDIIFWTVVTLVLFKLIFFIEDKMNQRPKKPKKFAWTGAEGPKEYKQQKFQWRRP
jgi:hypothetical protein